MSTCFSFCAHWAVDKVLLHSSTVYYLLGQQSLTIMHSFHSYWSNAALLLYLITTILQLQKKTCLRFFDYHYEFKQNLQCFNLLKLLFEFVLSHLGEQKPLQFRSSHLFYLIPGHSSFRGVGGTGLVTHTCQQALGQHSTTKPVIPSPLQLSYSILGLVHSTKLSGLTG